MKSLEEDHKLITEHLKFFKNWSVDNEVETTSKHFQNRSVNNKVKTISCLIPLRHENPRRGLQADPRSLYPFEIGE